MEPVHQFLARRLPLSGINFSAHFHQPGPLAELFGHLAEAGEAGHPELEPALTTGLERLVHRLSDRLDRVYRLDSVHRGSSAVLRRQMKRPSSSAGLM